MRSILCVLILSAIPACGQIESEAPRSEAAQAASVVSSQRWEKVDPGVWERRMEDGRIQRLNEGVDGLRAVLSRARMERAELQKQAALLETSNELDAKLTKNQALVAELESKLDALGPSDSRAERMAFEQSDQPSGDISAQSFVTGYECAGTYRLSVEFADAGMVDSVVDARSEWSEFGPYSEHLKTLSTYTSAIGADPSPATDSDSIGPFKDNCCNSVTSQSYAFLTFSPKMYGLAMVTVTTGCSFFRAYEEYYGYE